MDRENNDAAERREPACRSSLEGNPHPPGGGPSGPAEVAKARWTLLRQVQSIPKENQEKLQQAVGPIPLMLCNTTFCLCSFTFSCWVF